jgi:hypothetical protein
MVDSSGRDIGIPSGEYELRNDNGTTDSNGLAFLPVIVRFTDVAPTAKIYLMRFSYSDGDAISYSYGPYFYIKDTAVPPAALMDQLKTSGFGPTDLK